MSNAPATKGVSASTLAANQPLLRPVRTAYTEIALGMRASHDMPRTQHDAINYELTRLAIREHIRQHGNLPTWKPNERVPAWLSIGLTQVKRDFAGRGGGR